MINMKWKYVLANLQVSEEEMELYIKIDDVTGHQVISLVNEHLHSMTLIASLCSLFYDVLKNLFGNAFS